jgi:hypothetical protein
MITKMRIYIAAHDKDRALLCATYLRDRGHMIISDWFHLPFLPTDQYSERDRANIATLDVDQVAFSEALVLLDSPDRVPGGKFVEAGVALGLRKLVYVVGRRENMLMWHPAIKRFDTIEQLPL